MSGFLIHLGEVGRRGACGRAGARTAKTMSLPDVTCAPCRESRFAAYVGETDPELLAHRERSRELAADLFAMVGMLAEQAMPGAFHRNGERAIRSTRKKASR